MFCPEPLNNPRTNAGSTATAPGHRCVRRNMDIQQFAERHSLKIRRSLDDDGELIIFGKQGQIYQYNESSLGVVFMPSPIKEDKWGK
jgi:hypothetical protein